ncbi:MAG: anaerobic ribonucleoside-triphosphate reductase activating protein [Fusobacteria bacterium]|nr:anaerobic ribonucleoside-triphosphate reductase activating protein [Fusobacteriota bacterium]
MMFAGIVKSSTVDYPKKIVSTIFTLGCNFSCDYCQNADLIQIEEEKFILSDKEIIEFLKKRKNILDGVCITGGEPSIWGDKLIEFLKQIKNEIGEHFLIKVDTNGANPEFVKKIIKIVDFIAIDFKSLEYEKFSKVKKDVILDSIELLKNSNIDYEIRITMYPLYVQEGDFSKYIEILKGVKKIAIQQFQNKIVYVDKHINPYENEIIEKFYKLFKENNFNIELR